MQLMIIAFNRKWTTTDETNALVDDLMHNYKIKENDLQGIYVVKNFISVGDELPAGIIKLAKVYLLKNVNLKLVIKWQDVMVIKVLLHVLFVKKICHS